MNVAVGGVFAAVFAGLALYFVVRLFASRRGATEGNNDPIADASHGVMSAGMAAMFWPWGNPVPALYWQVLFSMAAAWFAVRLFRRGARSATILHHVLGNLAMVYMLAAVPAGHGAAHSAHLPGSAPGIALPVLAWAFVAYFLVFAVWSGARFVEPASTASLGDGPRDVVTSLHLLGSSHIVMGIGMSYMLVTML
ncbi:MAG: DUF5134 domain-containing protein [Pseudonocardiaceae bacterium]